MEHPNTIGVLIAHGEPIVAAGLGALLCREAGVVVDAWLPEGPVDFGRRPPQACDVQVVVADYATGMRLLAGMARLDARSPPLRLMLVTAVDREWEIRTAIAQGANGYVMQDCRTAELIDGLHAVARGRRHLCPAVALRMADSLLRDELTGRESDVLALMSAGSCNKSIARELGIAVGTVKAHVKGILEKLDATTRTQAVVVASRRGLVRHSSEPLPIGTRRSPRAPAGQFQVAH